MLTGFRPVKKISSHFIDFRQVKKVISHFTDFEQVKRIVIILLTCFWKAKKIWKIFFKLFLKTFLQFRDFSTVWRLFYGVGTFSAVYGVETFRAKSFLRHLNSFHEQVGMLEAFRFIRSVIELYKSVIDKSFRVSVLKALSWNIG